MAKQITAPAETLSAEQNKRRDGYSAAVLDILERYAVVGVWGVLILVYGVLQPGSFLTAGTFHVIADSQQALVFLSLALVCTFVVGEFDLSVASNLGLAATFVPVLTAMRGWPIGFSIPVAILASVAGGVLNGYLVVVVGVNPIVVTLGSGTLMYGIALGISDLEVVGGLSQHLAVIANQPVLSLPISFYYGIALALVLAYVLRFTPLGRHMTFVGANREVARLAGIQVNAIRFGSYVVTGAICGVGGVILVCGLGGFDPNSSQTYLLPAFSAVFLGAAIVAPGRFNPIGTMIAVYFLVTGIVGLQILGLSGWISQVFYGAALIIAVSVSALIRRARTAVGG